MRGLNKQFITKFEDDLLQCSLGAAIDPAFAMAIPGAGPSILLARSRSLAGRKRRNSVGVS